MELKENYPKISKNEVDAFCDRLKIDLPNDYIDFLLKNNGGQPIGFEFFKYDSNGSLLIDFSVNSFYGIGKKGDTSSELLTAYAFLFDRIPEELIPIGDLGNSDLVCLGVKGDHFGKVYIWWKDGESAEEEEPTFDNVVLLADTFNKFLNSFKRVKSI